MFIGRSMPEQMPFGGPKPKKTPHPGMTTSSTPIWKVPSGWPVQLTRLPMKCCVMLAEVRNIQKSTLIGELGPNLMLGASGT